jgi:DNA-binding IclR family transcriptional regulator
LRGPQRATEIDTRCALRNACGFYSMRPRYNLESMSDGGGRPEFVRSVDRALELLDVLADSAPVGVRGRELARRLRVDPATVSRMLGTLVARGYASRTPDRRYTVGPRSLRLATAWIGSLLGRLAPVLARIHDIGGDTVYLGQLLGGQCVIASRLLPGRRQVLEVEISDAAPLWATAMGTALLLPLSALRRKELLPPEPYPAITALTPRSWSSVNAALVKGRREGVFEERGQFDPGVGCLAAALAPTGHGEQLTIGLTYTPERPDRELALLRNAIAREASDFSWGT